MKNRLVQFDNRKYFSTELHSGFITCDSPLLYMSFDIILITYTNTDVMSPGEEIKSALILLKNKLWFNGSVSFKM